MKRSDKDQIKIDREFLELLYFGILTLLCIASLLRGCGARSEKTAPQTEQVTEQTQQAVSGQQDENVQQDETGVYEAKAGQPDAAPGTGTGSQTQVLSASVQNTGNSSTEPVTEGAGNFVDGDPAFDRAQGSDSSGEKKMTKADVKKNTYDPARFGYVSDTSPNITYYDDNFTVMQGIDVSEHQGEIDWETVADAGYGFVFVRVGFRGYGEEGTLNEDTMAVEYLQEAEKAGLQVGAYFFSQAINEEEAAEEAQFAADIVKKSGVTLDLPLVYDPEFAPYKGGRANYLTGKQVCKNTDAFRDAAEKAIKCKVALYTNLYWENNMFDAETLNEYEIWYADYEDVPDTPYHFTWWQYSESAAVPGIKGEMDLNLWIRRMD